MGIAYRCDRKLFAREIDAMNQGTELPQPCRRGSQSKRLAAHFVRRYKNDIHYQAGNLNYGMPATLSQSSDDKSVRIDMPRKEGYSDGEDRRELL
jgi:hypothetical protein